ncbi:hypothetical protein Cgig2_032191 [Carnegiea gigantea]|uniref:Protein FAR1-RELATED SEQUENCE n=1 Tax=Carnegiea gigantea TaxID=171969 RepID=A0A9Q1K3Y9_9CARY|nr:hypothetical protein Cgig2_032191 [Carnegiea gigantea]
MHIDLNKIPDENYEPFIGQTFDSEEEALLFYRNYAERHGFGIRKDRYDKKKKNKIVRHDLSCHQGRKKSIKVIDAFKDQRRRESSRCKCNANMRITVRRVFEIFPEEWHVSRVITPEDEEKILLYKEAGLLVRQIIRVMELKKKVEHGGLPFIEKNICNMFTKLNSLEEFEHNWPLTIKKYNLQNNKHMDVAIKEIELKRTHNNMTAKVRPTSRKTRSPLEEQAFQMLTPFAFKTFQEEIEKAS